MESQICTDHPKRNLIAENKYNYKFFRVATYLIQLIFCIKIVLHTFYGRSLLMNKCL